MKKYEIGFSLKGLIAFLIIMLPNIFWMISPPTDGFLSTDSGNVAVLNIIMVISQWIMIALLIFLIRKTGESEKGHIYQLICGLCVSIYYISWALYYFNIVSPIMLVGMAVFPCCFFTSFILRQKTYPVLIPAAVFSFIHIGTTVFKVRGIK